MVGLNSLLEQGGSITLPTGQVIKRHPDSIVVVMTNVDYDYLVGYTEVDRARLDELVGLMLDTVCSTKSTIRVAGEELPAEVVRSRLLKLTGAHLLYVLDRIRENTTDVRHVKPYLLTALYNAPLTMDNHYALMVGHDLSGGSG